MLGGENSAWSPAPSGDFFKYSQVRTFNVQKPVFFLIYLVKCSFFQLFSGNQDSSRGFYTCWNVSWCAARDQDLCTTPFSHNHTLTSEFGTGKGCAAGITHSPPHTRIRPSPGCSVNWGSQTSVFLSNSAQWRRAALKGSKDHRTCRHTETETIRTTKTAEKIIFMAEL